jgi:threonine synthase
LELLFYILDDPDIVRGRMEEFAASGEFSVDSRQLAAARDEFGSVRVDTEETLETISEIHRTRGYTLCPHTAVGFRAAKRLSNDEARHAVVLGTAHHGKFPSAVRQALTAVEYRTVETCAALVEVIALPARHPRRLLPNETVVKAYVEETLRRRAVEGDI